MENSQVFHDVAMAVLTKEIADNNKTPELAIERYYQLLLSIEQHYLEASKEYMETKKAHAVKNFYGG